MYRTIYGKFNPNLFINCNSKNYKPFKIIKINYFMIETIKLLQLKDWFYKIDLIEILKATKGKVTIIESETKRDYEKVTLK